MPRKSELNINVQRVHEKKFTSVFHDSADCELLSAIIGPWWHKLYRAIKLIVLFKNILAPQKLSLLTHQTDIIYIYIHTYYNSFDLF